MVSWNKVVCLPGGEEEGDTSFTSNCASEHSLSGTWRACQEDTLRKLSAKSCEVGRVLQEHDNFLKFLAEEDGLNVCRLRE